MINVRRLLLILLLACVPGAANARAGEQTTIVVLVDGFRADYIDRGLTPNLAALAARGARGSLIPVFPSMTLPNHFALLTGKTAEEHGIIDNEFEDPQLGVFGSRNLPSFRDPRFWVGAKPLWVSAEEQGIGTAHYFWPATGFDANGKRPAAFVPFSRDTRMEDEPALFLKWLDVGPAQRPRFLTLYFYYVDSVGHSDGPNSAALNDELRKVDIAIGNLVEGLRARGVLDQTNIIVTADHGMSEVAPSNDIFLDDLIDPAALHVISAYTTAQIAPAPGVAIDQIAAKLVGKHRHMECWRKENVPARFHYRRNPRIPPIICLAEPGWMISTRAGQAPRKAVTGAHGYDPQTADMTAIFVAAGPAFRSGARLPPISNLEFYPMLAKLIGVKPERSGRTGFPFKSALKD